MKKTIILTGLALMTAGLSSLAAQDIEVSGRVINAPYFDASHMLLFSQDDFLYGTSRSAAMGGAFTSLGADLSSMSINPAGLGMYRGSDWNFTTALSVNTMKTASDFMPAGSLASGGNRTSVGFNNFGGAFNVYNGSGSLTSFTLGVSYNRVANFNSNSTVRTVGERASIVEMFKNQLNLMAGDDTNSITPDDLHPSSSPFYNRGIYLDEWGAVLGYQTGLVNHIGDDRGGSYSMIPGTVPAGSYFSSTTRGGLYDYNFSMGANFSNILYLGATVGVTQLNYREDTTYEESFANAHVDGMWFDQSTRIEGEGMTAKFGAVVRPFPALRIGAAFHLPTYYTVEKSYSGMMGAGGASADTDDPLVDEQRFNSAPRLLAGISGVIAERAVIAVDWELAWYNKIRMRSDWGSENEASLAESEMLYKPAHTLRAGVEFMASDGVSFRAGGSYKFDFMERDDFVTNNPVQRSGYSLSAGVGFSVGRRGYLDLAYVYNRANYTNYDFYYFRDGNIISSQYDVVGNADFSREYTPRKNHHMITLTLGNRF